MGFEEHKKHAHSPVNCAVITVSSTRSQKEDISGKAIMALLEAKGHTVSNYTVTKDDMAMIGDEVEKNLNTGSVQAIIINGGTGIGNKDVTIEAVKPFLKKELVGFGELFRHLSYKEIGSPAIMSRALAGIASGKIIICLPGSTNACTLAMENLILPELSHMVYEIGK
jgi:molybdenum cofactor biosynthesis protein B